MQYENIRASKRNALFFLKLANMEGIVKYLQTNVVESCDLVLLSAYVTWYNIPTPEEISKIIVEGRCHCHPWIYESSWWCADGFSWCFLYKPMIIRATQCQLCFTVLLNISDMLTSRFLMKQKPTTPKKSLSQTKFMAQVKRKTKC